MRERNSKPEGLDILGNQGVSAGFDGDWRFELLKKSSGYMSVVAGISIAMLGQVQAQDAPGKTKTGKIPPGVQQRALEALEQYKQSCSTPELLRSQAKFRLPNGGEGLELARTFAGGDACPGNAVPAGTYTVGSPYLDSGTTLGANNTVTSIQALCSNYTTNAGPDHIYSFQLSARAAAAQISMTTSTGTYDPSIYILNGTTGAMCPAGTANAVTNCLQGADAGLAGGGETISTAEVNTLPLNTQLYLFVDSFYSTAAGSGAYTVRFQDVTVPGATPVQNYVDFNGDGRTDFSVVRNTGGGPSGQVTWFTQYNGAAGSQIDAWGIATDFFVPGNYDADNRTDVAIWRPGAAGTAAFFILNSATSTLRTELFGQTGDDPSIIGDYNNDGRDDPAVFRNGLAPGNPSFWYWRQSIGGSEVFVMPWGQNGDFPAPGDYDGDGFADFVIQRNNGGGQAGFWRNLSTAPDDLIVFGTPTDVIVPGDYDGDGKTDLAVVRGIGGVITWFHDPSSIAGIQVVQQPFGTSATDFPTQGDYDGDGKTDIAVWRPNADPMANFFYILGSTAGFSTFEWGQNGDYPIANYNSH